MESFLHSGGALGRSVLAVAFFIILFLPAWWLAGRIQDGKAAPAFRGLLATGLALVGYLSFVNLLGRLLHQAIAAVGIYLALNLAAVILLWRRWPAELSPSHLFAAWRSWLGPVALALVLGLPQWFAAVSTPFWDEVASSAIHVTGANQVAEGVFPPRHNAVPDVSIKYHYAFIILSGTVRWLSGLSANVSIDLASTALWLFTFLFAYFWLRDLDFHPMSSLWGAFATLLGGGLAWLYLPRIEAYSGVEKLPPASELLHRFDATKSWVENLRALGSVPSAHLRNADDTLSNLPWDIAAQFQQHAVCLGIPLTLVALYLFVTWQSGRGPRVPLLAANVATFSVLFLAHAVFGGVAAVTAGLCLLGSWLRRPTRQRFVQAAVFTIGVAVLALLHGGLLAIGEEYGSTGDVLILREGFGYSNGAVSGFLHWNLAGFGLPLLVAMVAWALYSWRRDRAAVERNLLFATLTVFAVFSYFVPQLAYYTWGAMGVEEFTEISKFFFSARLGLALLSVFAVEKLARRAHWSVALPGLAAMAIMPLAFCYASSTKDDGSRQGFYRAPYFRDSIEQQMGQALGELKKSNRDVYFDASANERRHGYLGEMLVFGGSVFTMTPSRYEQTGGYRLSEEVVRRRFVQNSRIWRLLPGAAEEAGCGWYYTHPVEDMARAPLIVRSRFDKLVAEGYLVEKHSAGARVLYSFDKPTVDLDEGIERYWRPRIVSQTRTDVDGDGKSDLLFYDYAARRILAGADTIELPPWLRDDFAHLYVANLPGESKVDFVFGRMQDTFFQRGRKLSELVEQQRWGWTLRDSTDASWQPEQAEWLWDWDIPVIADLDQDGFDTRITYRPRTKQWLSFPRQTLPGPSVDEKELAMPFAGRFLEGSTGDLGLWTFKTGAITLQSATAADRSVTFNWGGGRVDVMVSGDYDGDGYDEIGLWQRSNKTWYWRRAPNGPITQAIFGTDTGIPLPADYDADGRLDLAYWEPAAGEIRVSFTQGRSVELVVPVPPHSLPAFVNMY